MDCLSTGCFRGCLPNFIQHLFTSSDDASFWGGEEDLGSVIDPVNTRYVETGATMLELKRMSPGFASSESGQNHSGSSSDSCQAGESSGESMIRRMAVRYRLLTL